MPGWVGELAGVDPEQVHKLLAGWSAGDGRSRDALVELLYPKLRQLARRARAGEGAGRTLQTTALVHEMYMRLADAEVQWADAGHFVRVASRAMRRVLVDHARKRKRHKRPEGGARVDLGEISQQAGGRSEDFLQLDEAIERLLTLDERKGAAIELLYFGGLSYDEIANALQVSTATVHRELRGARAWLQQALSDDAPGP